MYFSWLQHTQQHRSVGILLWLLVTWWYGILGLCSSAPKHSDFYMLHHLAAADFVYNVSTNNPTIYLILFIYSTYFPEMSNFLTITSLIIMCHLAIICLLILLTFSKMICMWLVCHLILKNANYRVNFSLFLCTDFTIYVTRYTLWPKSLALVWFRE